MSGNIEQFVKSLEDSGLLSAPAADSFRESLTDETSAESTEELTQVLVQKQLLTEFQAAMIRSGRMQDLVFGNYVLLDELGEGGMGKVYKAYHRRMARVVAFKVLPAAVTHDEVQLKRFQREVHVLARLSHPKIVEAYDADEARNVHFLVTEYIEGCDLRTLVEVHGPLSVTSAVQCVLQACQGLEYAHSHGVVHRDVKPANLVLDKSGTVKILDLGLARLDDQLSTEDPSDGLTKTGSVMGTADFISPEQALNTRHADNRSDIYSLGCTLFYLLTGRTPYAGSTVMEKLLAHREQDVPSLREHCPIAPAPLDRVFGRMLAKKPEDRQQSIDDLVVDLKPFGGSSDECIHQLQLASGAFLQCSALSPTAPSYSDATSLINSTEATSLHDPLPDPTLRETTAPGATSSSSGTGTAAAGTDRRKVSLFLTAAGVVVLASVAVWQLPRFAENRGADAVQSASSDPQRVAASSDEGGPTAVSDTVDRTVAVWVMSQGGIVEVSVDATEREVTDAAQLPRSPFRVIGIDLSERSRITDDDLIRLRNLQRLRSLQLAGTDVGDAGLEHLRHLTTLEELDLEATRITDDGLFNLIELSNIKELDLELTAITDNALEHLSRLDRLEDLNIEKTNITDDGVAHLAELGALEKLDLEKTGVTDAGLVHLKGLHNLRELHLNGPGVTTEGVADLQQALPNCRILY